MFSVLELDDFFQILCAAMNEKSIVFVSSNLSLISSCVLGIQALMKPFNWPHLIAPVLPLSLYDLLGAPTPFIVGIPELPENDIYSENFLVHLDRPLLRTKLAGKHVVEPHANDLKEYLKIPYRNFGNGTCYSPSDDQVKAVTRISAEIRKFWNEIIEKIPKRELGRNIRYEELEVIRAQVADWCDMRDSVFLKEMVNTQFFTMTIEELNMN